jgi:hypothetical protein
MTRVLVENGYGHVVGFMELVYEPTGFLIPIKLGGEVISLPVQKTGRGFVAVAKGPERAQLLKAGLLQKFEK